MIKRYCMAIFLLFIFNINPIHALQAPPDTPRIHPQAIKSLRDKGVDYIFIDSSTFGDSHICGAIYIAYTWIPPYGENRIKDIQIPKDYHIFCY